MGKRRSNRAATRIKKRVCPIEAAGIEEISYKDVEFLKLFITEKGKILPRRISGINARNQKKLARAIKTSRNIALLSFSEGYVSQNVDEHKTYKQRKKAAEKEQAPEVKTENKTEVSVA